MRSCKFESCLGHLKALIFSAFSFMYDEIPGIRSVVSPGRQSEAAAPGENRSAPHVHTQIAHRSRNLAMPQCLRDRCQRHIFRLEKIRGEGSTDRMRRDRCARRDARRITRSGQRSGHCSGIRPFADGRRSSPSSVRKTGAPPLVAAGK